MNRAKCLLIGVLALAVAVFTAPGRTAEIASYRGDYLSGTNGQTRVQAQADGWDYMWNATAPIGTSAGNYTSLKFYGSYYNFDGAGGLPRPMPAYYLFLSGASGHPGRGENQSESGGIDRFPIAAYTVQSGEAGLAQITSSAVGVSSNNSGGVALHVYVNDALVTRFIQPGGSSGTASGVFNVALGQLAVGDTVYVAIGPNLHDGSDSFSLAYQIDTVTDTASAFWDADGAGPVNGGTGTWDTTGSLWALGMHNPGAYTAWNNAANKAAYFTGSGGAVTLGSAVTARALSFEAAYTLAGTETLTLTNAGSGGPGAATIAVVNAADTVAISTPIASAAGLNKIGPGTLVLTGATAITSGDLTAAGGTLRLADSSSTTVAGTVSVGRTSVAGGTSGTLTIQDTASLTAAALNLGASDYRTGTVNQTGGTVTISGTVRVGHYSLATSTYNLGGGSLSLTGTPSGTVNPEGDSEQPGILYVGVNGTGNFVQTGGTASVHGIVLDGRTETTGIDTFTLNGGTFTVGASGITSGNLNANAAYQINLGAGTLSASADWSSTRLMTLTGSGGNAIVNTNGHAISLAGVLSGGGGLTKSGSGTLVLSGANTYSGETRINSGGVLSVADVADNGSASNLGSGSSLVFAGGVLKFTGTGADATNRNVTISGAASIDVSDPAGNLSLTTAISGSGQRLSKLGPGTLTLNVATGTTTLSSIDAAGGNLVLAGSTVLNVDTTRVAVNPGLLPGLPDTQPGSGTLTIQDSASLTTGSMGLGENGSPQVVGMIGTVNQTGGTVTITGSARFGHWSNETSTYNLSGGTFSMTGTPTGVVNPTGVGERSGILYLGVDGTGHFVQTGGTASAHGIVLDARGETAGIESFTLNGGTFTVGPSGITSGSLDANTGYQIDLGGGTLSASANWSSTRLMTLTGAVGNAVFDTNGHAIALSGALSGSGGLTKSGDGTLQLTGVNTYIGPTTVTAGTLRINGSITSDVAVNGGVLGGTGTIGGTVTVAAGGTHAPGASVGEQTAAGAAWLSDGRFEFEINDAAGTAGGPDGWDLLTITDGAGTGALDLSGLSAGNPFYIDIISLAGTEPGNAANLIATQPAEWEFVTYEQLVGEFSPDLFVLDASGFSNDLGAGHFGIVQTEFGLAIAFIPEPGTLAMCLVGLLLLLVRRRR